MSDKLEPGAVVTGGADLSVEGLIFATRLASVRHWLGVTEERHAALVAAIAQKQASVVRSLLHHVKHDAGALAEAAEDAHVSLRALQGELPAARAPVKE